MSIDYLKYAEYYRREPIETLATSLRITDEEGDKLMAEIDALRTRLADAESALAEAREAFEILADAPVTDGWVIVAPQFVRANLDALNAALLAQPAAASIPPCCCAEIESAGVVNPDCLRHGAMHTAAASK